MTVRHGARTGALFTVAAFVLAAAGCGSVGTEVPISVPTGGQEASPPRAALSSLEVLTDPSAYLGPSTAVLTDATIVPISMNPAQRLPAKVISHPRSGDEPVTVTDTSRVVAMDLSGSIVATVLGLGLGPTLVGRDEAAAFPSVEEVPVVTGMSHTVNVESILALEPTLVITDGSVGPSDAVRQLADAGVPVVYVQNDPTFAGAAELARQVAAVYGTPAQGEALATRITEQVDATRAAVAAIVPAGSDPLRMVFVYLRGDSGIYYIFGRESGADELIAALGGLDAADDAGIKGMRPLTDEAMLAADPQVILVMTDGLASVGGVDGLLAAKPAISLTTAGRHRRIIDMDDHQILAFGPRSADVVDALARAIYAPGSA